MDTVNLVLKLPIVQIFFSGTMMIELQNSPIAVYCVGMKILQPERIKTLHSNP